jgi:hypothetical protein
MGHGFEYTHNVRVHEVHTRIGIHEPDGVREHKGSRTRSFRVHREGSESTNEFENSKSSEFDTVFRFESSESVYVYSDPSLSHDSQYSSKIG